MKIILGKYLSNVIVYKLINLALHICINFKRFSGVSLKIGVSKILQFLNTWIVLPRALGIH